MNRDAKESPSRRRLLLHRADQLAAGTVVGTALLAIAVFWYHEAERRGGLLEIDQVDEASFRFQVDINTADWPELTLLPEVGETIARRIVELRARRGPFQREQELLDVVGIGPKTLERIRPFLRPIGHLPGPMPDNS